MQRFQAGDEDALCEIVREHQGPLFSFIYRHVRDDSEAADILSQTFVKAWRSRARYRPRARFKTWLFKIASNLCRDWARRRKRHPADFAAMRNEADATDESHPDQLTDETNSADSTMLREESQLLHAAISELPSELREAVVMCLLEGYSQREAGQLLGCTEKAVEMRIYRARRTLKAKLTALLGESSRGTATVKI